MSALGDFLYPVPARRTVPAIVRWWEGRRLHYNLVVGGAGLLSVGLVRLLTSLPPGPKPFSVPLAGVLVFGVLANVCYLLGPAVESALHVFWGRRLLPAGPALFRMGLTYSVGLALLPALVAALEWVVRIVVAVGSAVP